MYHHHHTRRSSTSQYNAFPLLALHPCIHSLQSSVLAFCTLHPFLPSTGRRWCMSISLACRMFSCSCTVWVSLPHVLPGPYSFQNRSQSSFCPPPPSNILLIPVTLIIRSHPFLLLVRHTISPSGILHAFELLPLIPSNSKSTLNHLLFLNRSAQHLSIFLAILFLQFYCTTVLFTPYL